jgi:predicted nucleic-acid-binding Zn-ribbon protein
MSGSDKPCPKCKTIMQTNGVVHALPAYTGIMHPISEKQFAALVFWVCPDCRYVEMYLQQV